MGHPSYCRYRAGATLERCLYASCDLGKLLGCEAQFGVAEEHVALLLQRDQVDMGVGYFHAQHCHADALAGERSLQSLGHLLSKEVQACKLIVLQVEDIVYLTFGNHQGVTLYHGVDIEEGEGLVVFVDFVTGDFAVNDFGEDEADNFYTQEDVDGLVDDLSSRTDRRICL